MLRAACPPQSWSADDLCPRRDLRRWPAPRSESTRRSLGCLLEIVETLVLTLVIYLLIHNFIAQPFEVEQDSMVPTILEHEYILIDKLSPRFSDYDRGDIVVFQPPAGFEQGGVPFIKRVIGLPGDTVSLENGRVFVTPAGRVAGAAGSSPTWWRWTGDTAPTLPRDAERTSEWTVPEGEYFVMGDNRPQSQDSRFFGPIERDLDHRPRVVALLPAGSHRLHGEAGLRRIGRDR